MGFGKITPMKENFWDVVKVRWLTIAVATFLALKEEEYQSIQLLDTTNSTSREKKAHQSNVWHQ